MQTEKELLLWIKKRRLPYSIAQTSSSTTIETLGRKFFFCSGQRFGGRQFQTLKKLKEAAAAACAAGKCDGNQRAEFHKVNAKMFPIDAAGEYPCAEIDLKAAYPTAALISGIIDENLHAALMLQPKVFRTKLLGALASKKQILHFDENGQVIGRETKFSPEGVAAWRKICFTVGNRLANLKKYDAGFLAFWVDNYWTTGYPPALIEMLSGFECTEAPDLFQWKNAGGNLLHVLTADGRPFTFPLAHRANKERKEFLDARARKALQTAPTENAPPSD
jgi:hypothetical protein